MKELLVICLPNSFLNEKLIYTECDYFRRCRPEAQPIFLVFKVLSFQNREWLASDIGCYIINRMTTLVLCVY